MNNKIILFLSIFLASGSLLAQNTSAAMVKFKIYQIAVSEDAANCENPKVIFRSSKGVVKDLLQNPILGSGFLADGTYNCIMITMDDLLTFRPLDDISTGSACSKNKVYQGDLCRDGDVSDLLLGTSYSSINCKASSTPDQVTLYLKTTSIDDSSNNTFKRDGTNGITLLNPFIVKGSESGTFFVDTSNAVQVSGNGIDCSLEKAVFGFR